jgi:hypothetical protein
MFLRTGLSGGYHKKKRIRNRTCGRRQFEEFGILVEDSTQPIADEDLPVELDVPGHALLPAPALAQEHVLQMRLLGSGALLPAAFDEPRGQFLKRIFAPKGKVGA